MTEGTRFNESVRSFDLLLAVRDPIVIVGRRNRIVAANKGAETVFGYRRGEMIGLPLDSLVPARFRASHARRHAGYAVRPRARAMGGGRGLVARRKDGTEFVAEISVSPLKSRGESVFLASVHDLTGRNVAQDAREQDHRWFLQRLITAQDDERRRIARELHDEAGQALASLIVRLRALQDAATLAAARAQATRLRKGLADTIGGLGRLARGLHPSLLDDLGLVAALKRHAADTAEAFGPVIRFKASGFDSRRLPMAVETALYRIAQEALTNVARHSGAKRVAITLARSAVAVRLVVADDGRGFDPVARAAGGEHSPHSLGLVGIRERAAALGGSASIDSVPDQGTRVAVALPLKRGGGAAPRRRRATRRRTR